MYSRLNQIFIILLFSTNLYGQYDGNKIMTYADMKYLMDINFGVQKNVFDYTSKQCVTKSEAERIMFLSNTTAWQTYTDNQLIPFDKLNPMGLLFCPPYGSTTPVPHEVNTVDRWWLVNGIESVTTNVEHTDGDYGISVRAQEDAGFVPPQGINRYIKQSKGRTYDIYFDYKKTQGDKQKITVSNASGLFCTFIPTDVWQEGHCTIVAEDYTNIEISLMTATNTGANVGDDVIFDNLRIFESPLNLYPQGYAGSTINETTDKSIWSHDSETVITVLTSSQSPTNTNYLRFTSNFSAQPTPTMGEFSYETIKGREVIIEFYARVSSKSQQLIRVDNADTGSTKYTITPDELSTEWQYFIIDYIPASDGIDNFQILPSSSATGVNGDYVEIDNIIITQLSCE